jgi:hypothetical protein
MPGLSHRHQGGYSLPLPLVLLSCCYKDPPVHLSVFCFFFFRAMASSGVGAKAKQKATPKKKKEKKSADAFDAAVRIVRERKTPAAAARVDPADLSAIERAMEADEAADDAHMEANYPPLIVMEVLWTGPYNVNWFDQPRNNSHVLGVGFVSYTNPSKHRRQFYCVPDRDAIEFADLHTTEQMRLRMAGVPDWDAPTGTAPVISDPQTSYHADFSDMWTAITEWKDSIAKAEKHAPVFCSLLRHTITCPLLGRAESAHGDMQEIDWTMFPVIDAMEIASYVYDVPYDKLATQYTTWVEAMDRLSSAHLSRLSVSAPFALKTASDWTYADDGARSPLQSAIAVRDALRTMITTSVNWRRDARNTPALRVAERNRVEVYIFADLLQKRLSGAVTPLAFTPHTPSDAGRAALLCTETSAEARRATQTRTRHRRRRR